VNLKLGLRRQIFEKHSAFDFRSHNITVDFVPEAGVRSEHF
jgi:hypothetical protein